MLCSYLVLIVYYLFVITNEVLSHVISLCVCVFELFDSDVLISLYLQVNFDSKIFLEYYLIHLSFHIYFHKVGLIVIYDFRYCFICSCSALRCTFCFFGLFSFFDQFYKSSFMLYLFIKKQLLFLFYLHYLINFYNNLLDRCYCLIKRLRHWSSENLRFQILTLQNQHPVSNPSILMPFLVLFNLFNNNQEPFFLFIELAEL